MSSITRRRNIRRFNRRNYSPAVMTYINAVNRLKSRRNISRMARRMRSERLRQSFKNSIREHNRRRLLSKLRRGAAYKKALLRKNRRKFANRKANTQQRNIALATINAVEQINERNKSKPVQTREKAQQQQQENQQAGSGIENVTKKLGAAISTVANIRNAIPRDFSETISVEDINSVTENDEKINELNNRNREISVALRKNIDNLREFDRELKTGLSNAQCGIGKKCFTNEADITPQKVVDKLTKAYSDIGNNNKELKELLNSQCGNIPCFNDKDRKLKSNKAIKEAVKRRITEIENLRAKEKISSADLMAKKLKAQKSHFESVISKVNRYHRAKLYKANLKHKKQINEKIKEIKTLEDSKKSLEKTNKELIKTHADEIAAKQSEITKLEGDKKTLNDQLTEKEKQYQQEIKNIKQTASNKIKRLEYVNRIYKRLYRKERGARISLYHKAKKAISDKKIAEDAKKLAETARDEALAAASSSEKAKAEAEKVAKEAAAAAAAAEKDAEKSRKEAEEAKKERTKAQEEKLNAEKARDEASSALNKEKEKLLKLKKEKENLETSLNTLEIQKNNLVQENNDLNTKFEEQSKILKEKNKELESTSIELASKTLKLKDEIEKNNQITKNLSETKSEASQKIKELENKIVRQEATQKITIENVKANYKAEIKKLEAKFENEKNDLKKKEMDKMNARIIEEREKYDKLIADEKNKTINRIKIHNLAMKRIEEEREKEKREMKILQIKYNNVSYLKEKYRKESEYKSQLYKNNLTNLKRKQLNEINIYKLKQNNLISSKNRLISIYKTRSINNFKAGYMSSQRTYNRKLQLKNAEITRLRSSSSSLLIKYKKAQIKAENIARARGRVIRNLATAYNSARIAGNILRARNTANKLKYASLLRKKDNLIRSKNNIISYYQRKTSSLRVAINIEKVKNKAIANQNKGLKIVNTHLNNMNNANIDLINKQKNEISNLKDSVKKLESKEKSLTDEINSLKETTKIQTEKINEYEKKLAEQNVVINGLRGQQLKNLNTIKLLNAQLKSKIYVSQCGSRGYTKTSGINKNVHFFNGKKYIREDSIISDKIKLNGKDYVKLINGKCLNQYSRPCPKPKIIFKKSTRSATVSDIKKHNFLYRKYRCAIINNRKNKHIAYRRWIQQRNLIRGKTRKYPRYPPFNSRMCGRSRGRSRGGSRGRNRCVSTCARYKSLIIAYNQKIVRLTRAYNVNINNLRKAQKAYRRYNGTQVRTPAYNYRRAYLRFLSLYRREKSWPFWRRRKKNIYRTRYLRYLRLLKIQIARGRPLRGLISTYSRNASNLKKSIGRYKNLITNYKKAYPRQLR